MNRAWRYFLPGYLLNLPATLVGILIALIYWRGRSWRLSDGCIEVLSDKMNRSNWNGQTLGNVIVYANSDVRDDVRVRVHERVHVVQGFWFGPLLPVIYGVAFAVRWLQYRDFFLAYRNNPIETQAYRHEHAPGAWGA